MFMTSGSWGPWHDAIRQETIYSIPARLPKKPALAERIVKIVDSLRMLPDDDEEAGPLFASKGITRTARNTRIKELEAQLDEAVYELFELTEEEKERIREMCSIGLDLFYKGMDSAAVEPLDWPDAVKKIGRRGDLRHKKAAGNELCDYVAVFVDLWEPQLRDQAGRFRWRVVRPQGTATMLAAVFQTETAKEPLEDSKTTDDQAWREVLIRLEQSSRQPTNARRIYIDGLIRIVTDEDIVIIKRNERRLWTPSSARDDAEATMLMAAQLAEEIGGDNG
jgi:hypothetical protein